ncbi:Spo0B domain-containing protein [Bhargavaea ullalensis]|uniref:SpoOB alpha-helical domain-containing protein n=1 Tax=Bhargavaea ullalensis TaxID=1265685 RepID=A0ABV2G9B5_9BACL
MEGRMRAQELLRHARHDQMNTLHLIRMQLDLGMEDSVRRTIDEAVEKGRRESMLGALGMPATAAWLLTFGWRHPEYEQSLSVEIESPGNPESDLWVERYLEELFGALSEGLSPYAEYRAEIHVESREPGWLLEFNLSGPFDLDAGLPDAGENAPFETELTSSEEGLKLIVAGRKVDR